MADPSSRRDFVKHALAAGAGLALARSVEAVAAQRPRRLIIDSHQHYEDRRDYVSKLVETYRARQAMACVLTPMAGFVVVRKAAADHPDVVIPFGQINVDATAALVPLAQFAAAGFKGIRMPSPRH